MADEIIDGAQNNTDALEGGTVEGGEVTDAKAPVSLLDMDDAGEGAKPGEGDEGTKDEGEGAPEEYADFQLPEGMPIDPEFMEQTKAAFKDAGLTQEKAQALVNLVVERDKRVEAAQYAQADQWAKDFLKSPTAKEDLAFAAKARAFVTPGLREMLKDPRIGNNPEILATFAKIGRTLAEDQLIDGGRGSRVPEKDTAQVLFGDVLK